MLILAGMSEAVLRKCTVQRCQGAPSTCASAALRPGWGVSQVLIESTPAQAYVVRDDESSHSSFLVKLGTTTVIVRGPFSKEAVPTVAAAIRPVY